MNTLLNEWNYFFLPSFFLQSNVNWKNTKMFVRETHIGCVDIYFYFLFFTQRTQWYVIIFDEMFWFWLIEETNLLRPAKYLISKCQNWCFEISLFTFKYSVVRYNMNLDIIFSKKFALLIALCCVHLKLGFQFQEFVLL